MRFFHWFTLLIFRSGVISVTPGARMPRGTMSNVATGRSSVSPHHRNLLQPLNSADSAAPTAQNYSTTPRKECNTLHTHPSRFHRNAVTGSTWNDVNVGMRDCENPRSYCNWFRMSSTKVPRDASASCIFYTARKCHFRAPNRAARLFIAFHFSALS